MNPMNGMFVGGVGVAGGANKVDVATPRPLIFSTPLSD